MAFSMTTRFGCLKYNTAMYGRRLNESEETMADDSRRKMDAAEGLLQLGKESIIFKNTYDTKARMQDSHKYCHQNQSSITKHHQHLWNRERGTSEPALLQESAHQESGVSETAHNTLGQSPYISDSNRPQNPVSYSFNRQGLLLNRTLLSTALQLSTNPQDSFPDPTVQPCPHILYTQEFCVKELCNHGCCIGFRSYLAAEGTNTSEYVGLRAVRNTPSVIASRPGEDVLQSIEAHFAAEKAAERALKLPLAEEQLKHVQCPRPRIPTLSTAGPLCLPPYSKPKFHPLNHQHRTFRNNIFQANPPDRALKTPQQQNIYPFRPTTQAYLAGQTALDGQHECGNRD